jgi:hypothetical protein
MENLSTLACVFVAAVTFLPSPCLAMTMGYTYRHTERWEEFMQYGVEIGSGVMIYIHTKFQRDWFSHSKVDGGINRHTQIQCIVISPTFTFFLNLRKVG